MRGLAISFVTLARVACIGLFRSFLMQHAPMIDIEMEAMQFYSGHFRSIYIEEPFAR